jgi:hypothetical protein
MSSTAKPRPVRSSASCASCQLREIRRRTPGLGAARPAANPRSTHESRFACAPTPAADAGAGAPCETHNPQEEAWGRGVVRAVLQPRYLHGTRPDTTCQLAQRRQEAQGGAVRLTLAGRCGAPDGRISREVTDQRVALGSRRLSLSPRPRAIASLALIAVCIAGRCRVRRPPKRRSVESLANLLQPPGSRRLIDHHLPQSGEGARRKGCRCPWNGRQHRFCLLPGD